MVEIKLKGLTDEQFSSMNEALNGNRAYEEGDIMLCHPDGSEDYSVVLGAPEDADDDKPIIEVTTLVEMCTLVSHDDESDTNEDFDSGIVVEGV